MDDCAERLAVRLRDHRLGRQAETDGADPTELYLEGLLRFELGCIKSAIDLMRKVVALRPNEVRGHAALARLLSLDGQHRAAVGSYQAGVALCPDDGGLAAEFANALRATGDIEAAVASCREAFARCQDIAPVHEALGSALLAAGDAKAASVEFDAAVHARPERAEPRMGFARALICEGRNEDAIAALDAVPGLHSLPSAVKAESLFLRGTAHKALQEFPAAIAAFQRAVAAEPRHAAAHLNLGNCLVATERAADALKHLQRAIEIDPMRKEAHASLGSALLLAGDERAAERSYRQALAIDPDMIAPHQNLAAICDATGRAADARRHRDAAYGRQNMFIEPAGRPRRAVLLLTTAKSGNVPTKFLFRRDHCTLVKWFIEYAGPDDENCLPPYDLVFNGIGDPDEAAPTAAAVERFIRDCPRPVLNHPVEVERTRRDLLPDLLQNIPDIVVPAVRRILSAGRSRDELAAAILHAGMELPVLLRRAGSHGGEGVTFVETREHLAAARVGDEDALYVTQFCPYRSVDGAYRKYRMIFVDRCPYPYHLAIAAQWLVHYVTAGMPANPAKCEEEKRFLEDPERAVGTKAMRAIRAIGQRIDLDFAGIDFSILPDRRVLVFEANATMLVHPEDEAGSLAYRNPAVRRILDAFDAMVEARLGPFDPR